MDEFWAKPLDSYVTADDSVPRGSDVRRPRVRAGSSQRRVKHLPSENKQELTAEPHHSQILWQIHQLAADVICIWDYRNLSMSGLQPNLVSNGRSCVQFAFQDGPDLEELGMQAYREDCTNILTGMIKSFPLGSCVPEWECDTSTHPHSSEKQRKTK